ncbi:zinc-binding dehydrogenase [Streptomyces sp. NBC_00670]|nr:zinc-binding dehydrogenase [Streptomyces sp. NBC_00670]
MPAPRAAAGTLRVGVDTVFPLTEAAKAHTTGLTGHAPGTLVLIP